MVFLDPEETCTGSEDIAGIHNRLIAQDESMEYSLR